MSVKRYRFFGQVQEVGEFGETTDCGWSVFHPWVKYEDYAALLAATQWRPIETAPKDGTWVLVAMKKTPCGLDEVDSWCPGMKAARWYEDGWYFCSEYSVYPNPTHWMPIPKPPSA